MDHSPALKYTHFFFDLDGTLINSNKIHERAYCAAIREELGELLEKKFHYDIYLGMTTYEVVSQFLKLCGFTPSEKEIEKLILLKRAKYREFMIDVPLFEGALELLSHLKSNHIAMCIATGSTRHTATEIIEKRGISQFFDFFVTADDVTQGKPNPDVFLTALRKYGISRESVLVIEDAQAGAQAACSAGLDYVLVNQRIHDPATNQFSSLKEFYDQLLLNNSPSA